MTYGFLSAYFLSMSPSTAEKDLLHGKKWVNMHRGYLVDSSSELQKWVPLSEHVPDTISSVLLQNCITTASWTVWLGLKDHLSKHRATLLSVSFVISKSEKPVPSVGLPSYLTAHDARAIVGRPLQASEKNTLTASLFDLGWRPVWGPFLPVAQRMLWEDLAFGDPE